MTQENIRQVRQLLGEAARIAARGSASDRDMMELVRRIDHAHRWTFVVAAKRAQGAA